jgi:AcrR family transcriptional regulator
MTVDPDPHQATDIAAPNGPEETSEERRARLRERLVEEAWRLLSTEGLGALQARRVAQLSGCSVGAIYNVFPDLDELILRANTRTLAQFAEVAATAAAGFAPGASFAERLGAVARAYLAFTFANETRWRSLFDYRLTYRKPYPEFYRAAQRAAFAELHRGLFGARAADVSPALSQTLWAAVHGVVSVGLDQRLGETSQFDIESQIDRRTRLIGVGIDAETMRPAG